MHIYNSRLVGQLCKLKLPMVVININKTLKELAVLFKCVLNISEFCCMMLENHFQNGLKIVSKQERCTVSVICLNIVSLTPLTN